MKLHKFDPAKYLDDENSVAEYLNVTAQIDPAGLGSALGDVARARSMTELARLTGMSRTSLYRALSENGNPSYATICKVIDALHVQIRFVSSETLEKETVSKSGRLLVDQST
ncbi:MAG: putative addiction module antidote protein [Actinomycetes bacterium]|jgi:probable addiction module antidote protein|nr:putative addiction module antidote protein [Actinomycetes bacterium]